MDRGLLHCVRPFCLSEQQVLTFHSLPGCEPEPQYLVHCQLCRTCEAGDDACNCIKGVEDEDVADGAYDGVNAFSCRILYSH